MILLPIYKKTEFYQVNPTKIIALGLNYREHIAESDSINVRGFTQEIPIEPILFAKTPNCLLEPEEPIILPKFLHDYGFDEIRTDYEAELVFIIKDRCKNIPREKSIGLHFWFYLC